MESNCCYPAIARSLGGLLTVVCLVLTAQAADTVPSFYRGLNLNGPPLTIDGNSWEGQESTLYVCKDHQFDNQAVTLLPDTDDARAKMIRSSRYGGNRVELNGIPPGSYTVFLYVWEDNDAETYSLAVNGRTVLARHNSGKTGHWDRLGPWPTIVKQDSKLVLTSQGGTANFSGIEVWQGNYDGLGKPISEDQLAFFEKRIRPLLVHKCYECHSADSSEVEGDLLVDSRATIQRGGANGPAIVPGDVEHSLLIEAIRYQRDELQMPPDEKLGEEEIADFERWVAMGAPDPRGTATKHLGKQIDITEARQFWSLKPVALPATPSVKQADWPRTEIDRFVLAKMEERELMPAADADKRVLIRRATYDLLGLPPTPAEVDAFLADDSPDAFARVVDRLLDSPRYGERWGRYWLDVVRYADTAGDNSDFPVPQIYRYRDWVIAAFNKDQAYDEFVRDQLAGDLRGGQTEQERVERLIATGYLANARRFGSRVVDYPQHLTIEDTIDNLGRSFLGLTLSCARCHDHKFDPITNRDYYGLYGIFHSTRYPWPGIELDKVQRDFVPLVAPEMLPELEQAVVARAKEQARLDLQVSKLTELVKKAADAEKNAEKNAAQADAELAAGDLQEVNKKEAEQQLSEAQRAAKEHRELPPLFETAYAVAEAADRGDVAIQLKGDPAHLGDVVPRHFLTVLGGQEVPAEQDVSGRAQLADWILAPDNPLPARVMVNRIWQYHFGRGIVATPNDFGKQGRPPTHPELLDYLATQFRAGGWSIKSMHRLIMLSRTYQQSSSRDPRTVSQDPSNEWLAGYSRRRLDAESIRDSLLALGGTLDLSSAGPHPFPPQHSWGFTQHNPFKEIYDTDRRSVYLMTQRIQRHPFLAIFDGADPSTSTASRMVSTTPLQALYLLNDPFVHQQARRMVERITSQPGDDTLRIDYAYQLLFARPPVAEEIASTAEFLTKARALMVDNGVAADRLESEAWQACMRSLLRLNEFVYLD